MRPADAQKSETRRGRDERRISRRAERQFRHGDGKRAACRREDRRRVRGQHHRDNRPREHRVQIRERGLAGFFYQTAGGLANDGPQNARGHQTKDTRAVKIPGHDRGCREHEQRVGIKPLRLLYRTFSGCFFLIRQYNSPKIHNSIFYPIAHSLSA